MIRKRLHKPVHWAAVIATVAAGIVVAVASPAYASASGTVNTAGAPLNEHSGPGTGYVTYRTRSDGASVTILCQTSGTSVTGTYGTSSLWDMLSDGGFVSDAYVYTGSNGMVTHSCTYSADPPRANPNGRNAAIDFEFARLGHTDWEGWCLAFQATAYGWSYAGWYTAESGGDWIYSHGYMHSSGIPPRGALVWYHNSDGTGHITLSLGEGLIVGTSVNGQIGITRYNYMSGYRGWSVAYFPLAG